MPNVISIAFLTKKKCRVWPQNVPQLSAVRFTWSHGLVIWGMPYSKPLNWHKVQRHKKFIFTLPPWYPVGTHWVSWQKNEKNERRHFEKQKMWVFFFQKCPTSVYALWHDLQRQYNLMSYYGRLTLAECLVNKKRATMEGQLWSPLCLGKKKELV